MCYHRRIILGCGCLFPTTILVQDCKVKGTPECKPRYLLEKTQMAHMCAKHKNLKPKKPRPRRPRMVTLKMLGLAGYDMVALCPKKF
ncbi:hypothetical protein QBC35DRAFT_457582 [Podospora australis]|uniref:Uncharacterized protein n=1 Tax=Podospora australis TaxID=1536484 RepID=A0AAN7ADM1_9PEZI|nr:hypothetical protein QBC35DRAFT_457582 [Podospora australis]